MQGSGISRPRVCKLAPLLASHTVLGGHLGVPVVHIVMTTYPEGWNGEGRGVQTCPAQPLHLHPLSWAPSPQMTYSLARFAIYETVRDQVTKDSQGPLPFYKKVLLGSISGELPGGQRWAGQADLTSPSHCGSGVCRSRLHWRLRGDPCRYGQRQVSVAPSWSRSFLSPECWDSLARSAGYSAWNKSPLAFGGLGLGRGCC